MCHQRFANGFGQPAWERPPHRAGVGGHTSASGQDEPGRLALIRKGYRVDPLGITT